VLAAGVPAPYSKRIGTKRHETARTGNRTHCTLLIAVRLNQKFVGLQAFHDLIVLWYCVFKMHVHWVFVTKYRRGVFTKDVIDDLRTIFTGVCIGFG
jgi:hypothetical protein